MTTVVQTAPDGEASAQDETTSLKLPVSVVVLTSTILSMVSIGRGSFSLDESVSVTLARSSWHSFGHTIVHREANMSFYYLLLRFWTELGHSEAVARSFSVVASLGTLATIMVVARQLFDRRTAIIAGILLAVDPLIVFFAQDARGYALSILLATASSALFARAVTSETRWGPWVAYVVVSVLATYTNFWVALMLIGHAASLAFLPPRRAPWRRLVPTGVVLGILLVPLALLIRTTDEGGVSWEAGSSAGKLFTKVRADVPHPVIDIVVLLVVAFVIGIAAVVRRHPKTTVVVDNWPVMFALCWLVVPVVIVVLLSLAYQPVLVLRYLGICFPPFILLAAYVLSRVTRVPVARLAVLVLVLVSGVGLWTWYSRGTPEDFRGAVDSLAEQARPGDGLVIFAPYNRVPVEWYMHDHPVAESRLQPLFPAGPWSTDALRYDASINATESGIRTAVQGYHRVWLLLSAQQLYPAQDRDVLAGLRAAGLDPVGSRTFPGVEVVEYADVTRSATLLASQRSVG
jgi:mannosyltransferase